MSDYLGADILPSERDRAIDMAARFAVAALHGGAFETNQTASQLAEYCHWLAELIIRGPVEDEIGE